MTMIAFGGPGLRTAYVTTANPPGAEPQPLGGALFAFEAPAPGVAIPLLDDGYFK